MIMVSNLGIGNGGDNFKIVLDMGKQKTSEHFERDENKGMWMEWRRQTLFFGLEMVIFGREKYNENSNTSLVTGILVVCFH